MTEDVLFTTERTYCRPWLPGDVDAIYAVYSDEEGARWVDDGTPISYRECLSWMDITLENYLTRGYGMYAIVERNSGRAIGFCGLVHPAGQVDAEVKYAFLRDYWGRGFASEVVPAMLSYARGVLNLTRVIATVASENFASQRVLLKAGMKFSGFDPDDGDATRVYEWAVLDSE